MSYKRYIKKNGKLYGPYTYESRWMNGKVVSNYVKENKNKSRSKLILILSISLILLILIISIPLITNQLKKEPSVNMEDNAGFIGLEPIDSNLSLSGVDNPCLGTYVGQAGFDPGAYCDSNCTFASGCNCYVLNKIGTGYLQCLVSVNNDCTGTPTSCTQLPIKPPVNLAPWFTNVIPNKNFGTPREYINFSAKVWDDGIVSSVWFKDNFGGADSSFGWTENDRSYVQLFNRGGGEAFVANITGDISQICFKGWRLGTDTNTMIIYNISEMNANKTEFINSGVSSSVSFNLRNFTGTTSATANIVCMNMAPFHIDIGKSYGVLVSSNEDIYNDLYLVADIPINRDNNWGGIFYYLEQLFSVGNGYSVWVNMTISSPPGGALVNQTLIDINLNNKNVSYVRQLPSINGTYQYAWCANDTTQLQSCDIYNYLVGISTDTSAPSVSIISPTNNSIINYILNLYGNVTDASGVGLIYLQHDNKTNGATWYNTTCTNMPTNAFCSLDISQGVSPWWNNTAYTNGTYRFRLIGCNLNNSCTTSSPYTYIIDNGFPSMIAGWVQYPLGQSSARNTQTVVVWVNASDDVAGINTIRYNPANLNGTNANITMVLQIGNRMAGGVSVWNGSVIVNANTNNAFTDIQIFDNASTNNVLYTGIQVQIDNDYPTDSGTATSESLYANTTIYFFLNASDNFKLRNFTLSINNSGTITNNSQKLFTLDNNEYVFDTGNWTSNFTGSYKFYYYDDAGNMNQTAWAEFMVGNVPAISVNLGKPEEASIQTEIPLLFYNYTGDENASVCSLYLDDTLNKTENYPRINTNLNFTTAGLSFGEHTWNIECFGENTYALGEEKSFIYEKEKISINLINLFGDVNVTQNTFFNVALNISCLEGDCGEIKIYLDPEKSDFSVSQELQKTTQSSLDPEEEIPLFERFVIWIKGLFSEEPSLSPSKGLISTMVGEEPFYTNSNPIITSSLDKGQSEIITFWVNATGELGDYEFFAYANLTSNESIGDITPVWNVMINETLEIKCNESLVNSTKSGWINLTCSLNQMNQSQTWTEYDKNNCGFVNQTFFEYRLVGPIYQNTSWSLWSSPICQRLKDLIRVTRNLTSYDIFACANNITYFEDNYTTANLTNTTKTNWNAGICDGNSLNQSRSWIQYDSKALGCYPNQTFLETNYSIANLTYTAYTGWINQFCVGNQMNQSRERIQYDSNALGCFVNLTLIDTQLVGPNLINTTKSEWENISCLSDDKMNQSQTWIEYDFIGCKANVTWIKYQNVEACDFCTPNMVYSDWGEWQDISCVGYMMNKSRTNKYYDLNNCDETEDIIYYEYQLFDDERCIQYFSPYLELFILSPLSNISIEKNDYFNVSVLVKCFGNNCGEVKVSLDPEQDQGIFGRIYNWIRNLFIPIGDISLSPIKGMVSTQIGAEPFYTNGSNPKIINLNAGDERIVSFWVNATGELGDYDFFAFANLTLNENIKNESNHFNVKIISFGDANRPIISSEFDNIFYTHNPNLRIRCSISDDVQVSNLSLNIFDIFMTNIFNEFVPLDGTSNSNSWDIVLPEFNNYTWSCYGCDNSSNCALSVSYTIIYSSEEDISPPTFIGPRNFSHIKNIGFSQLMVAEDMSGINDYWLDDSSVFEVNSEGLIRNITDLSSVRLYPLVIYAEDMSGNIANLSFYINITESNINAPLNVIINNPISQVYSVNNYLVDILINNFGNCTYSLNNGITNKSLQTENNLEFISQETNVANGNYVLYAYCSDLTNKSISSVSFSIDVSSNNNVNSGGGGGGGGGAGNTKKTNILCNESWSCSSFGECVNGIRIRECRDLKNCNTTKNKPSEQEFCEEEIPQITDIINNEGGGISWWMIVLIILILILLIILLIFYKRKERKIIPGALTKKQLSQVYMEIRRLERIGRYYLDRKQIISARGVYSKIRELFNLLTDEEQSVLWDELIGFYSDLTK